jgi:phospholipase C
MKRFSRGQRALAVLLGGTMLTSSAVTPSLARGDDFPTKTPIKHLVIIFQENASYDHYFGTYPNAKNDVGVQHGGTKFTAREDTPSANGLTDGNAKFPERVAVGLHNFNPNNPTLPTPTGNPPTITVADPNGNANPFLMFHDQIVTCSQNHAYTGEQKATDAGFMDKFPQQNNTNGLNCSNDGSTVMGYFDGTTITALWNYAQRFAISDNSWGTTYGPSTPGALNLISGQIGGAIVHTFSGVKGGNGLLTDGVVSTSVAGTFFVGGTSPKVTANVGGSPTAGVQTGTLVNDLDPYLDDCGNDKGGTAAGKMTTEMQGKNVGDLLNAKNITWGWFAGGFRTATTANPATSNPANIAGGINNDPFGNVSFGGAANDGAATGIGTAGFTPAVCNATHVLHPDATVTFDGLGNVHPTRTDYNPHHSPFQYYASTRNPHHLPPTSVANIGKTDQANHQYDVLDFYAALKAGNLPAVSFLKGINRDDGHPGGESDPLAEQRFLVQTINQLQASPEWAETAVFIAWDDSDGWYDHASPPLLSASAAAGFDAVADGTCGSPKADALQGRCGLGPRLVLNMVSPWSKENYVDHSLTDQSSLLRFVEDNWDLNYIDGPATHDPNNGLRTPNFTLNPGTQSFDVITGSFDNMFDFDDAPKLHRLFLDPVTGAKLDNDDHDHDHDHD